MYSLCPGYSLGLRGGEGCVFMTHFFRLSLEFCALARPGPSIMNSVSVDQQVSSMLDSECFNRLGSSVAAFQKMKIFQENVKISRQS